MRIERYSSEQFAGILGCDIKFKRGMNVVFGKNETGKSTMIAGIYHTFMTSFKMDKRKQREFIQNFFPSNGAQTIDARIVFTEGEERYIIEKVWDKLGSEASAKFCKEGEGIFRGKQAEEKIREILQYTDAVYENLVFGHQKQEQRILEWFYQFFSEQGEEDIAKVKQKIREAFSVAGGISEEKFMRIVEERRKSLSGKWDFLRDRPEKGRELENAWINGRGEILEAYYSYRQAEREYETAVKIEEELETAVKNQHKLRKKRETIERQRRQMEIQKIEGLQKNNLEILLKNARKWLEEYVPVIEKWPMIERRMDRAKNLQMLQEELRKRRRRQMLENLLGEIEEIERELFELERMEKEGRDLEEDVVFLKEAENRLEHNQLKLKSSKLFADICLSRGQEAKLFLSGREDREIFSRETLTVEGELEIEIQGVAKIRVVSENLDLERCQAENVECQQRISNILEKYFVKNRKELEERLEKYRRICIQREAKATLKEQKLCGRQKKEIEEEKNLIEEGRGMVIPDFLEEEIEEFLETSQNSSLDNCMIGDEIRLQEYKKKFGSLKHLKWKREEYEKEVEKYERELESLRDIESIAEKEYENRRNLLEEQQKRIEEERNLFERKIGVLSEKEGSDILELKSEVEKWRAEWERQKKTYQYCEQIKKDFMELKKETGNQFEPFYEKLNQNLKMIAKQKKILTEDRSLKIMSGKNDITKKEFLSEGMKKTLLLVFRLAVLEYFYKEEEGILILDDSLLDMDSERREGAAELLRKFAEKNQVIFTTCDPGIVTLLGGNVIELKEK